MWIEMKVGSVIQVDFPGTVQVRAIDPAIATAKIDGDKLTLTALKVGGTWFKVDAGDIFGGLVQVTVTGEQAAKK